MLDIKERIEVIKKLVSQDSECSLTYAALECRLTIEYIAYERFKASYAYLSPKELEGWSPRDVVRQVAADVNDTVCDQVTLHISKQPITGTPPSTLEEYESLDYIPIGTQAELKLGKLHSLWHGVSNTALHIPIPTISTEAMSIYGQLDKIKSKVQDVIDFLSDLQTGNMILGGTKEKTYNFSCDSCRIEIKKTIKSIGRKKIIHCINPKCKESYLIEEDSETKELFYSRRVFVVDCKSCGQKHEIPTNIFKGLKFEEALNIQCSNCHKTQVIIMRPMTKIVSD